MAWPLNHIAATDMLAARTNTYNRKNITGHGHEAARGSSVSRPGDQVGVFPGRATKPSGKLTEAALPTCSPAQFICRCWKFLRLRGHLRWGISLGNNAKVALRPNFGSAPGPFRARGQLRR